MHETYAHGGRPSIDPIVFFKLQLVMFFENIRSERQLMRHAADRLSVKWYLGYDLNEPLPDHSTLSKIRLCYGLDVFRRFFDSIIEQCQQAKLVWGRELYFNSTQVNANADLDSLAPRFAVEARGAFQEHLAALFKSEPVQPEESVEQLMNAPPLEQQLEDRAHYSLSRCLPESLRHAARNSQRRIWLSMTGLRRKVGNSETCTVPTNAQRIFASVPPILMRRRCA